MLSKQLLHRQRGVTAIGWLIILGLIAFFTLLALRIVPMYLEYFGAVTILDKVASEPNIRTMRRHDIDKEIDALLDVNQITDINKDNFIIKKNSHGMTITLEYEVRAPMFKEIGIYGHFKQTRKAGAY